MHGTGLLALLSSLLLTSPLGHNWNIPSFLALYRCRILPSFSSTSDTIERANRDEQAANAQLAESLNDLRDQYPCERQDDIMSVTETLQACEEVFKHFPTRSTAEIAADIGCLEQCQQYVDGEDADYREDESKPNLSANCSAADISGYLATALEWIERHLEDYGEELRAKAEDLKSGVEKTHLRHSLQQTKITDFTTF